MCYVKHPNPPRNHRKPWTKDCMVRLVQLHKKELSYTHIGKCLGRTTAAVITRACILRIVVKMSPVANELKPITKFRKKGRPSKLDKINYSKTLKEIFD